jgi:Fe-S-cluster containining protein
MIDRRWCQVIKCLSFHAGYRCRHSGACCRTDWDLPFDTTDRERIEQLGLATAGDFREGDSISFARRRPDGACVFLASAPEGDICTIHRAAGHDVLPVTCRMFPRIALHDARGTMLTLSHYCPTAASLLFEYDGPTEIVEAAPSLTGVGPLDGLDAREVLPPLLRDGVLMDLESFAEWERWAIGALTMPDADPRDAVARVEAVTAEIATWSPGEIPLLDAVRAATRTVRAAAQKGTTASGYPLFLQRWLAAHLFGNWIAYQGCGIRTIVRYLRACLDVFTIELARDGDPLEAIRRSDFLIVHQTDSQQLAAALDALLRVERTASR